MTTVQQLHKNKVLGITNAARCAPSFFDLYFQYSSASEVPPIFTRWCAVVAIGAILGRNYLMPFGSSFIKPNIYAMLIGNPGTRKSTAIRTVKKFVEATGFTEFAAERTSKEKFLLDLEGAEEESGKDTGTLATLLDLVDTASCREMFITADEFNDFVGPGNLEFLSMLGSLWDFDGIYKNRIKHGKSVAINNPTVSMLAGNTHVGLISAFPPEAIGQGFMSRLILVYSEPNKKRVAFPTLTDDKDRMEIITWLLKIKENVKGTATFQKDAYEALETIYYNWKDLDDRRFLHYSTRRQQHLLKLCMVCAAARISTDISIYDVILANTILTYTETLMPKAIGEFGKSRHSEVTSKIMDYLYNSNKQRTVQEIWGIVAQDLEKMTDLTNLLQGLVQADKIFIARGGFLAKSKVMRDTKFIDFSLLQEIEI